MKVVVKNLEEVAEGLRDQYEERDGAFVLNVEDYDAHPLVKGMKDSLEKNKKSREKTARELAEIKAKDIPEDFDRDEWDQLKEFKTKAEADALDGNKGKGGNQDDLLASRDKLHMQKLERQEKKHSEELVARDEKIAKLESHIKREAVDNRLTKALLDTGFAKVHLPLLKSHFRNSVVISEEDGEYVVKIKTADGELVDLVKYCGDYAGSDEGKIYLEQAKGAGAEGSGRSREGDLTGDNPWKDGPSFSLTKQGQILRADRAKAERLARAVGKKIPAAA